MRQGSFWQLPFDLFERHRSAEHDRLPVSIGDRPHVVLCVFEVIICVAIVDEAENVAGFIIHELEHIIPSFLPHEHAAVVEILGGRCFARLGKTAFKTQNRPHLIMIAKHLNKPLLLMGIVLIVNLLVPHNAKANKNISYKTYAYNFSSQSNRLM